MNTLLTILMVSLAIFAFVAWVASRPRGRQLRPLANIGEGRWPGGKAYLTDAAVATRYLLGKIGTDASHIALAGTADIPLGVITDEASAAEESVHVEFFGAGFQTRLFVASAAIAAGDLLVSAANGKVRTLPVAAGTYHIIGRAIKAAAADGDQVEAVGSFPIQRVVA
ncbi:MAG: DUF2190 family protein [Moraxellaceae bacterium]|nr:DUF2190 family protein [Moraxellaceae bacterium]